jgi:hypothetical protein
MAQRAWREMLDASEYRAKAQAVRERAQSARDPVSYRELMNIAAQYEDLARQVEKLAHDKP